METKPYLRKSIPHGGLWTPKVSQSELATADLKNIRWAVDCEDLIGQLGYTQDDPHVRFRTGDGTVAVYKYPFFARFDRCAVELYPEGVIFYQYWENNLPQGFFASTNDHWGTLVKFDPDREHKKRKAAQSRTVARIRKGKYTSTDAQNGKNILINGVFSGEKWKSNDFAPWITTRPSRNTTPTTMDMLPGLAKFVELISKRKAPWRKHKKWAPWVESMLPGISFLEKPVQTWLKREARAVGLR